MTKLILTSITSASFLAIGFLLFTNHWGVAIRAGNFIFLGLCVIGVLKLLKNEKD